MRNHEIWHSNIGELPGSNRILHIYNSDLAQNTNIYKLLPKWITRANSTKHTRSPQTFCVCLSLSVMQHVDTFAHHL